MSHEATSNCEVVNQYKTRFCAESVADTCCSARAWRAEPHTDAVPKGSVGTWSDRADCPSCPRALGAAQAGAGLTPRAAVQLHGTKHTPRSQVALHSSPLSSCRATGAQEVGGEHQEVAETRQTQHYEHCFLLASTLCGPCSLIADSCLYYFSKF